MFKKMLLLSSAICLMSSVSQAEDDVVVDLSVLDNLQQVQSIPLRKDPVFPVVSKEAAKPKVKKAKKPVAPKIVEEPKPAIDVVAEISAPEDIAVDVEPVSQDISIPAKPAEVMPSTPTAPVVAEPVADPVTSAVVEPVKVKDIEPLIPTAPAPVKAAVDNQIRFIGESAALMDMDKEKIDSIIASFQDPQKNKISIISYNFDDGENSFKNKRLSLKRATEIRSYLLSKGFKDFSFKIVNVTGDSSKKNVVEIVELKQ